MPEMMTFWPSRCVPALVEPWICNAGETLDTLPCLLLMHNCLCPVSSAHSWHTYKLLVYMHEVPDLNSKGGIRRLDRYDQLAEYVFGKCDHELSLTATIRCQFSLTGRVQVTAAM